MQQPRAYDYIIVGAGPAGLQLGYFLAQRGRNYLILEAGEAPGTFFSRFPRHDTLLSINKVYTGYADPAINLRWDWNSLLCDADLRLQKYSRAYFPCKSDLVHYLGDFATRFQLHIQYGTHVTNITKEQTFQLLDQQGRRYQGKRLIIATGLFQPYIPPIPGIEHAERYTHVSVNPEDFVNQRVLVIGKGNAAFETADNLIGTAAVIHLASPHPVTMAWQSHFVGHLRAVNNSILDTYRLKSQNAILDATIERIVYTGGRYAVSVNYTHAAGERECLQYDRVIVCTGFRFDVSMFDATCRPALTIQERFPAQTSAWESTNVQDLYFAGTLMQMRDYRRTNSAFIHGFRYNLRALYYIFESRYHGGSWPSRSLAYDAQALAQHVLTRVNTTSALWHQFGYLCDVLVLSAQHGTAQYYEAVPMDYVRDGALAQSQHYYLITLEYGSDRGCGDPFNMERIERHDTDHAHLSHFLHPVIRRFTGPRLVSEHHIIEDLEAAWREDEHMQPLLAYLRRDT